MDTLHLKSSNNHEIHGFERPFAGGSKKPTEVHQFGRWGVDLGGADLPPNLNSQQLLVLLDENTHANEHDIVCLIQLGSARCTVSFCIRKTQV